MANETKKEEIKQARAASDSTIRELQQTVDALPRTDHMTLPAIMVTKIDDETKARMAEIAYISSGKANDPDEVVGESGRTLQQVRNEFTFGVSDLSEEGGKHKIEVTEGEDGTESVTIIPPVHEVAKADGEVEEVQGESVVVEPTPANIAPVDADAPHNPVEAREAAGLAEDGSEGDPIRGTAPINVGTDGQPSGAPQQPSVKDATANQNLGTAPKTGGGQEGAAGSPDGASPTGSGTAPTSSNTGSRTGSTSGGSNS